MFHGKSYHICSLEEQSSDSYLPTLSPFASPFEKLKRCVKKLILVSEANPYSFHFYRKAARLTDERKAQVASGSWIIHPFSIFRHYYDMYMGVIFFVCLIHMPLYGSYHFLLGKSLLVSHNLLCTLCIIDILITFLTGRCASEEIIMEPKKIALSYIFGPYFICDVVSSIPDSRISYRFGTDRDLVAYLALLKIVRMMTFNIYMDRILMYFRVKGYTSLIVKLVLLVCLICHFLTCFFYFTKLLYIHFAGPISPQISEDIGHRHNITAFYSIYPAFMYQSASFLLAVRIPVNRNMPGTTYIVAICVYIMGRILAAFFIVVFVDVFKISNYLEIKYQEMMSQVSSYVSGRKIPSDLQNKIILYYEYKYHHKYLNEERIEKFLSEKLKAEIRVFECRRLINSVTIFRELPQKIMERVLSYMKKEFYMSGEIIIKAGTTGVYMYFMASGTVSVVSPSGKEICHLHDGDYFGEVCLLAEARRTATVTALEHCEMYKLEKRYFKKCFEGQPTILREMHAEAKRRYAEAKEIERKFMKSFAEKVPPDTQDKQIIVETET